MKRFLLSILMVVIGLSAFSQSPSRFISLRPAYPVAIGESTVDGIEFSNNGLYMYDILQDSLPQYEIEHIDVQTVSYTEEGYGFYLKADSLHSLNVVFSYEVNEPPQGTIEFNEMTGRFKYYPVPDEYKSFVITFTATDGIESLSEDVVFNLMPRMPSEADAFRSKGTMPDAGDYTIIAESSKSMSLNNQERTAYSISISGKDVIFDDAVHNKVWGMNGRDDIYELNIYAERLIIRNALRFPQTNVTIYAKELIFEDSNNEKASINTTPIQIETLTNGEGENGANAGNINLYIREFKGDVAIRFILNGSSGQSSNRNGTPGNGGNGGTLCSTLDISSYCDFARGCYGMKYDVAGDGSTGFGPVIDYGKVGDYGNFEKSGFSYLHPNFVTAVIRHIKEAFINNYTDEALQICHEYRTLIDEYLASSDEIETSSDLSDETDDEIVEGLELQNNLMEINNMLLKLEQGLDYFGNPIGWVPLLSFEVYLQNYENEIDRAIPTLYMYYWMNRVDQTLQNMVIAKMEAANQTEEKIGDNIERLNSFVQKVPELQDKIEEIMVLITELTDKLTVMENIVMAKAKKNVKKRERTKKMFSIGKTLASVLSVIPGAEVAGASLNTVLTLANNMSSEADVDYSAVLSSFKAIVDQMDKIQKDAEEAIKNANNNNGNNNGNGNGNGNGNKDKEEGWKSACISLFQRSDPALKSLAETLKILSQSSVTSDEVQKEFARLKGQMPWWNAMEDSLNSLNTKKINLQNTLNEVTNSITTTLSELNNDALSLDAYRHDAFTNNSKRDLNAKLYMANLAQRAKDRLQLYDYYLRKAYEYRLLRPYEGENFNLVSMFERFERLGLALDSVVNYEAYETLGSVFRERISDMTQKILREYTANYSEQSAPITIVIPKEQLDAINADKDVTLNFQEMGVFSPDEENVRIVNLEVLHMDTHTDGSVGYSGYMDLNMTHSGISKFRKDGHLYWFDHMSRTSTNPHTWGVRYDAISGENNTIQPSAASTSLLYSLIGNNDNIMLFSRPSAWSDITLSKKVHTSWGADIVVDSLVIRLKYDFTRRPSTIRNIDVSASNNLLPYIACSEKDVNGRSGGNGHLLRSYKNSSQSVTFTAIDKYETYYFKNWTDRSGKVVSGKTDLTVNRQKDQFYIANYERRVPILNVPDTVTIREFNENNEYVVYVGNIGSGDMEMDWYVSDSLSTSVHLNGIAEGINDGCFTFSFDSVPNGLDSLEIFAPETDEMSKMIYIAVDDEIKQAIADKIEPVESGKDQFRIYPNPMREYVKIEGEGLLSVCIYSITGKEMYRRGIDGSDTATIDVAGLPNGIYILSVNTRNGVVSKKMLKTN